ncbi:MAG: hypothetical protein DRZ82_00700 [Thermoprotei archaeon]|nr:MAG: hypothetical protein DRZ82_00700 [Thermoprotei archaeon]
MMVRLVIMGLDALDPDLVERWKMCWFMQKHYGRHYVGMINKLYTPILWSCFLTGLNVEKYGYSLSELREKRTREAFRSKLLYKLYLLRKKIPIKKLGLRKLLVKLGLVELYPGSVMPEHLLKKSFLEELKAMGYSVGAIEIPGYNETRNEYYRVKAGELISSPFSERVRLVEEALEDTKMRVAEAIRYVERGYDVVFTYSPLPDIALHMTMKPDLKAKLWIRSVHYSLYKAIRGLLDIAGEYGYAVLIVSDHGFDLETYYHSKYGFWSLNIDPPAWWDVRSILDFKKNILKLVRFNIDLNQ